MEGKRIKVWVQAMSDRPHLVLQWHDPLTGKRKSRSAGTKDPKKAEEKRCDLEADLNAGRHQEPSRMSVTEFLALYDKEHLSGVRPGSRDAIKNAWSNFARLCPKASQLGQITTRTLSSFAAELRAEGKRPGTVQVQVGYVHTALRWALAQKFLHTLPDRPAVPMPKKRPQPVPLEAWEKLLAAALPDPQMTAYLLCGWLAGLRLDEAYRLSWQEAGSDPWLDLAGQRIVLPAEGVKGDTDQDVPLDPALQAALLALPRHPGTSRVFRFLTKGGRPLKVMSVSWRIRRLATAAGVKLTMRSLRRGFGCRYAARVPAQVLQRLLRHANIATSAQFYINCDEAARRAVLGDPPSTPL